MSRDVVTKFTVALKLQNSELMHDELMELASPHSVRYGQYYSQASLQERFGPSQYTRNLVSTYLKQIKGATVHGADGNGDFLMVTASVKNIEEFFSTSLSWRRNIGADTTKRALRADTDLFVPDDVSEHISFISLNSPVSHLHPRATRTSDVSVAEEKSATEESEEVMATSKPGVTAGNKEALLTFKPICQNDVPNQYNPPCALDVMPPYFKIRVFSYSNAGEQLAIDPLVFDIQIQDIFCMNSYSGVACSGADGNNCTCITKVSPLPMYTQLKFNITYQYGQEGDIFVYGASDLVALTDVMTASILNDLYAVPPGLKVRYGSNQSVVEFYEEVF